MALMAGTRAALAQSASATDVGKPAGNFPVKPIRLLVSGVGGAGDFAGRLLAADLTLRLGQQVKARLVQHLQTLEYWLDQVEEAKTP